MGYFSLLSLLYYYIITSFHPFPSFFQILPYIPHWSLSISWTWFLLIVVIWIYKYINIYVYIHTHMHRQTDRMTYTQTDRQTVEWLFKSSYQFVFISVFCKVKSIVSLSICLFFMWFKFLMRIRKGVYFNFVHIFLALLFLHLLIKWTLFHNSVGSWFSLLYTPVFILSYLDMYRKFFFKALIFNTSFHTKSKYLIAEVEALKIVPITVYRLKIGQSECYIEAVICFPQSHKYVSKEVSCFNYILGKMKQISKNWKKV